MLLQLVVVLGLGVLGSSAPLQGQGPPSPGGDTPQQQRSRTLALIIRELLQDMKKLKSYAVPSAVAVNATMEKCMHSHLQTFVSTLGALNRHSKAISRKLSRVSTYRDILPQDLTEDCQTAQVTWDDFLDTLDTFLRLLSEKI